MACIASGCEERWTRSGTSGTSFFSLPASPERQNKWLQYAGVEKAPCQHAAFLCSKHFSSKFLRKSLRGMTLRPNAIPDVPMLFDCETSSLEDYNLVREELVNEKRECHVGRSEHFDNSTSPVKLSNDVTVKQPIWPLAVNVSVDKQNIFEEKNQEDSENSSILQNLKNNICRVCGRTRTSLLPIFGNHLVNEISISEMIQMHLPLEIKNDDNLPLNVCMNCNAMIQAWHDLHTSCLAADAVLRRMFVESTEVVSDDSYLKNSDQRLTEGKREEEEGYSDVPLEMSSAMSTQTIEETPKTQCSEKLIESKREMVKETNVNNISLQFYSRKSPCLYCSEYFESLSLKQHKLQCQLRVAMCEFCGICVQIRYLKSHMCKVHKKTLLCEICGNFFSWYNLKQHREVCALEATNYCEPCCRLFYSKEGYDSHMREHTKGAIQHFGLKIKASFQEELSLIYHCPVCEDNFDNKLSVIVHLNSYKVTTCKPCNKDFRNERSFLAHVHIPQKQLWHCRQCFKVFGKHYSWQIHERSHGRNKPFTCTKCEKHYPSLESLLQHSLCHSSSLFECSYCEKKFNRQILLKEHFLYHEGFIYKCKLCRKQFRTLGSLKTHKFHVHKKMNTFSKLK